MGLTFFEAHVLAYVFGLEVVIVSLTAAVDEAEAGIIMVIIPPTTKKSHAGAGVFWHLAYICGKTPELKA